MDDEPDMRSAPPSSGPGALSVVELARLPGRAALIGLAGVACGIALSLALGLLGLAIAPHIRAVRLLGGQIGLWTGLVGACVLVSRRYGTGSLRDDFAVRAEGRDVARGVGISIAGRFAGGLVAVPLIGLNRRFAGTNTYVFQRLRSDKPTYLLLAIIAAIGAPLVEELFFRGLMMRALERPFGLTGSLVAQALLFGCAHINPLFGLGNVSVVAVTATLGVILGITARRFGRLGPGMLAHGFFNLVAVVVIAAQ